MTGEQVLGRCRQLLTDNHIENSSLESEILLRHTLKIDRVQLYLDIKGDMSQRQAETFWSLVRRRLAGEPTAYITGHREFYGLDFRVDPGVLIPRPESELLVEMALEIAQRHPVAIIADVGTGCGTIAISLALHLPLATVYAIDISTAALDTALINCQRHKVTDRVRLLQGDILEPLPEPVDLIAANLPYVRQQDLPDKGPVGFEPTLALDGGQDGLQKIRRLCYQLNGRLRPGGHLLIEIGQGQAAEATALLHNLFPLATIAKAEDLRGIKRVVHLALPIANGAGCKLANPNYEQAVDLTHKAR